MTYMERIATECPAALIAEQVEGFMYMYKRNYPANASVATTYAQARRNEARQAAVLEQLRAVWREAKAGNDAWRTSLAAVIEQHPGVCNVAAKRWQLIAKHSPSALQDA